ncbi:MAG: ABC transporter substrate-binding protein [Anaerolineales bacterium]
MKTFRFNSIILIVAFLLTACGPSAPAAEHPPLKVGWRLWPGWYPIVIADQKGFFTAHGVEVELVFYTTIKESLTALASGKVDGASEVLSDVLVDSLCNDVKVVLITANSNGADQLAASPEILGVEDLRGKRIGIVRGTFSELWVLEVLELADIPASEVTFVDVDPSQVAGAIPATIDLGHTFEPFSSESRAKGQKVIFSSEETPGLLVDIFAFRKETIEERPEDVQAFVDAWFEATKWWQENPAEGNALIAEATGLKPEEVSLEGVKLFDRAANLNAFNPAGTDNTSIYFTTEGYIDRLIELGVVSQPAMVEDMLDASFVQK